MQVKVQIRSVRFVIPIDTLRFHASFLRSHPQAFRVLQETGT